VVVIRALQDFTSRMVRQIVLDVTANLIEDTPRDTGWAAANWFPIIGGEGGAGAGRDASGRFTSRSDRPAPEDLQAGLQSAHATQQQLIAQVATSFDMRVHDRVTIANKVPYINRLNEGHSRQAPAGFVQAAIARGVSGVRALRTE